MYPSVTFVGRCFVDKGVRIIATGGSPVILRDCHVARAVTIEAGIGAAIDLSADYVGPRSVVVSQASITVGPGTKIAEMVVIRDADHDHARPLSDMAFVSEPIVIGEDVWVGAGAAVLKGVRIGDHATVAAGSVVTRDVVAGSTVGGVPGRDLHLRD